MPNPKKIRLVHSKSLDTCKNLAFEEYFMNTVKKDEWIVFWWQSKNAVVIGRNQNPYQECNLEMLKNDNVQLVRRLSGGGAVYHDTGNINFSFIGMTDFFDIDKHFKVLIQGLSTLGIKSKFTGRNDLTINKRKFSGNAFIHDDERHLHHGTLLIDSDVTKIADYLNVDHKKLDTKGFDSVKSRVINLKEVVPNLSIKDITDAVKSSLKDITKAKIIQLDFSSIDNRVIKPYIDKYYSDLWNYGDTPSFSCEMEKRYKWGNIKLSFDIEDGVINKVLIETDALEVKAFDKLSKSLKGIQLIPDKIYNKIIESGFNKKIANDIYQIISINIFN